MVKNEALVTPDQLLHMPDGKSFELVDGKLFEKPACVRSSIVEGIVIFLLSRYCFHHDLGAVLTSTSGIRCFANEPDNIRRPDLCFVQKKRLTSERLREEWLSIAPDLAVEVLAPGEKAAQLEARIEDYLNAGIRLVWVINPGTQTVAVYRADGSVSRLHKKDELSGEEVIPGFRCLVADLFSPI